jgi:para-nitrobenzyl esterase
MTLVETKQGRIRGELKRGVAVWRNIPYAEPPLGALRFLPPRPPRAWQGERDGTGYSAVAFQSRDPRVAMLSGITDAMTMSEDCLVLDVYSPAADGKRRPVLVWIHGGAFVMGAGTLPLYSGSGFAARHDVVVVGVNYRLGPLGLLYLGELLGEPYAHGNATLLDHIAALSWVRDNIAAFGGDPGQVTVMGESAGAIAISNLLGMPSASGLFHRAILQSGAPALMSNTRADATEVTREVLDGLGVGVEQLTQVPAEQLVRAQDRVSQVRGLSAFQPCIDGITLPRAVVDTLRAGDGVRVPLLLGTNRDEWALFDLFMGEAANASLVARMRGKLGDAFVDKMHAAYGGDRRAWCDIFGDLAFRIPALRLADAHAAPVYVYRFDWQSAAFGGKLGAAHALELPFVWNRLDTPLARMLLGDTESAQPLTTAMHDTWAAFIKTGDPNGCGLPQWPRYDRDRRATMVLARESHVADDPGGDARMLWASALSSVIAS